MDLQFLPSSCFDLKVASNTVEGLRIEQDAQVLEGEFALQSFMDKTNASIVSISMWRLCFPLQDD